MTGSAREIDLQQLKQQIGHMNVLAISGGRTVTLLDGTVNLPVASGYSVNIALDANDTYTVRRMFKRGAKTWVKGERSNVYCDEIGEVAYKASCFRNGTFA
jgi:hypothetical protein